MKANFLTALTLVLAVEKGFVDNPADPGGATNLGVTQVTYDKWRKLQGLPLQSVRLITVAEAGHIYKAEYWDPANCDELPSGVDYCVFDFDVNSSEPRAAKFLQHVLYLKPDGVVGSKTIDTASRADPALLCFALCFSRLRFMEQADWDDFGKGWSPRVLSVLYQSLKLCSNTASHT